MSIDITQLSPFRDVFILTPPVFADNRGRFSEVYNKTALQKAGISCDFVQDNESYSKSRGTVRGLHFQLPPFDQAKLVRVLRGAVIDVMVDLRKESSTFGRHALIELDEASGKQVFIPTGFAHGFCTLTDDAIFSYKVSAPYSKDHDRGLIWNDPDLGIEWPVTQQDAILSDKDKTLPMMRDMDVTSLWSSK